MKSFNDAKSEFLAMYGAEWFMMANSHAFRAAMELAARYSPSRNLPQAATPVEILQLGVVYAAQDQGYHSALQTLEGLSELGAGPSDPTFSPDYQGEQQMPEEPMAPAPEAPRRPSPKPQPKKKK